MSFLLWVLGGVIICFIVLNILLSPKKLSLKGSHVLITGGSMGIGRSLGVQAAKLGANVSILARNQKILDEAKKEIEKHLVDSTKQKVFTIAADLTQDQEVLSSKIKEAEECQGPVLVLINNAGISACGKLEDVPLQQFRQVMEVNYLGAVSATQTILPGMKQRGAGRIVFISSQAGQLGVFGFGAYSPSKFALRGLAEVLQMEVKPYNMKVTIAFPPDTDTPGFQQEIKSQPIETRLISDTSGLFTADKVAQRILKDMMYGRFQSSIGLDGYMLSNLTSGMSPVGSALDAFNQVLTMSIFRAISFIYLRSFDRVVKKCKQEAESSDKKSQ